MNKTAKNVHRSDPDRQEIQISEGTQVPKSSQKLHKHYDIEIYRGWCKACGICVAFCPRRCIELDEEGTPVVIGADQCTGCGWCELHCPDFAISVHEANNKKNQPEE